MLKTGPIYKRNRDPSHQKDSITKKDRESSLVIPKFELLFPTSLPLGWRMNLKWKQILNFYSKKTLFGQILCQSTSAKDDVNSEQRNEGFSIVQIINKKRINHERCIVNKQKPAESNSKLV